MAVVLVTCAACSVLAPFSTGTANAAENSAAGNSGAAPLTIVTPGANNCNGDIFFSPVTTTNPTSSSAPPSGPEIVTNTGKVVWFHALPTGDAAYNFTTQTYLGQPVLTWFQGVNGVPAGVIYNDRFQQIATVRAGNGYSMDEHEFLITPWNTALIVAFDTTTANLTSIGGRADQKVYTDVVQEIDIKTGKVLFQWNPADHVPYSESYQPLPSSASTPWDWFHMNAVRLDADGNLLVSSRNTWTVYKVNRNSGRVMWQLGGKQSSFTLRTAPGQVLNSAGKIFAWQHDPEGLGHGLYTFFDDESGGELPYARAVTVSLSLRTHVATLIKSVKQPEGQDAGYVGNAQTTRNGDLFVSWGNTGYISEYSPSGTLLFNAKLPSGIFTYRAYRLPWPPGAGCGAGRGGGCPPQASAGRSSATAHDVVDQGGERCKPRPSTHTRSCGRTTVRQARHACVVASATVGRNGGTLGPFDIDGAETTLTIPPGAFTHDGQVTITTGNDGVLAPTVFTGFHEVTSTAVQVDMHGSPFPGTLLKPLTMTWRDPAITAATEVTTWNGASLAVDPAGSSAVGVANVSFDRDPDFVLLNPVSVSPSQVPKATVPVTGKPLLGEAILVGALLTAGLGGLGLSRRWRVRD